MVKGLAHAGISVKNMEKSIVFYRDILGAKKIMEIEEPKGEPFIEYFQFPDGTCLELFYPRDAYPLSEQLGRNHLSFYTEDIDALYERLTSKGVEVMSRPQTARDGNLQLWCIDPNGYRVEFLQYTETCPQRCAQEVLHVW